MKNIHLICNAHLDPVWLWEWEEGAAEALSTFRIAADFCDEFDGFIFNHNEAILYKWVEEYEPLLFKRIQRLVQLGKWHIMGGWYLQPDCNMPSGESFVRQILYGRKYFKDKFGAMPTTAINFDPFGHSRGLVQILAKSGYNSYIFCRPSQNDCPLPSDEFIWVGFDGSEIIGHRAYDSYLTHRGKASGKVKRWIEENSVESDTGNSTRNAIPEAGLILWGIGNHGGGPSRIDLEELSALINSADANKIVIKHSTPEAYFNNIKDNCKSLPRYEKDINPWAVGCYTSQIRIKQQHRKLENELYMVEKMASCASLQGLMVYPKKEIDEALLDLLTSEFHDILPGSSIQLVEDGALRTLNHGHEIVSRIKARAFFSLAGGQSKAKDGEIPILVYNPHPYSVKGIFECEFQLADQNWADSFTNVTVYSGEQKLPSQVEKELGNLNLDWRKRVAFIADLQPGQMNRFDCRLEVLSEKPKVLMSNENGSIIFNTEELEVIINCSTGLIDRYRVNGIDYMMEDAFKPFVIRDDDDPWGMHVKNFKDIEGEFILMQKEEGTEFSGVGPGLLESVRIIEDGEVRTVIESVFSYRHSFLCQRYKLPKHGTEIEIELHVHWNEKSKMLKLSLPTKLGLGRYIGQTAYGTADLPVDRTEAAAQKWTAVISQNEDKAVTCINNGTYGSDFYEGELRLSLLRSPGYAAHPIPDRPVMPQDRYSTRIDQGERIFSFWINAGTAEERLQKIDREALVHNEKPYSLSFFPSGNGNKPLPLAILNDEVIQITTFKKAESSDDYIMRLFNPTSAKKAAKLTIPVLDLDDAITLKEYEIKTLKIDVVNKTIREANLLEQVINK